MQSRFIILFILLAGLGQVGCKKNNSSGPPVITGVRLVDSTKRDSLFTKAVPGILIDIVGRDMDGLKQVFFNDTPANIIPTYATSTNIILPIPSTAQTAATNPKVPSLIRLVTDHGTATFSFTLVLPAPYVNSLSFDNTGTKVFINGANLAGISKVTFPGGDTALSYTVNKDFTQIAAVIPPGSGVQDSIRVYCTYGIASYPFPPPMSINSVSNENAIAGDTITITGTNFVRINNVTFPGNIVVSNVTTISVNQLQVVVPAGITVTDSLRINGVLGTTASPQLFDSYITHPSPGYLSTFDTQQYSSSSTDNTSWLGWTGGYAAAPATAYPNATGGVAFLKNGSAMNGNTNPGSQGNSGFIQLLNVPWVANTATPIAGYSLKFEVYVAKPWSAGEIWIMMGGWYGWHDYLARYAPWASSSTGTFQPSGWVTVTIPLTQFVTVSGPGTSVMANGKLYNPNDTGGPFGKDNNEWDFQTFPTGGGPASLFSDFTSTALCFTLVNDQSSPSVAAGALNIAIDNVRIVKGQ